MKKVLSLVIALAVLISIFPVCVGAYQVGDVVGYALSTDIVATINDYDIPSYNVDGYTYIVAEDLQYYGFSVIYDNSTRSLSINRDSSQQYVSKSYVKPYVSSKNVGQPEHKILYTDIVTYLDGNYVQACNIDGQTIIRFDSLSAYGDILYDHSTHEISLSIQGIISNPNPVEPVVTLYALDGRSMDVPRSQVADYETVGWYLEPVITMYTPDGKTAVVGQSEIVSWQNVGWYTAPVTTIYLPNGTSAVVCTSDVDTYLSQGWSTSPVFSMAQFLNNVNGWWVDLSSCRPLPWDDGCILDFIQFNSGKVMFGSTYSEFWEYELKELTFTGSNTYRALFYMPGYWYGDEYYKPSYGNATITYSGGNELSIKFDGSSRYTYTFVGTTHDFDSIQRHPLVVDAAR